MGRRHAGGHDKPREKKADENVISVLDRESGTKITGRDTGLDVMKGLCIIFVVFVHCVEVGNGETYHASRLYMDYLPYKLIYGLMMPVFMCISGWLFSGQTAKKDTRTLLREALRKNLLPMLCWSAFGFGWQLLLGGYAWAGGAQLAHDCVFFALSFVWYLTALLFASLLTLALYHLRRLGPALLIPVIPALLFIPDNVIPAPVKYMYPYFIAGYLAHRGNLFRRISKPPYAPLAAVFLAGYLLLMRFWGHDTYIYSGFSIIGRDAVMQISANLLRWAAGFVGAAFIICAVQAIMIYPRISGSRITGALAYLGKNSLYIYIISSLVLTSVLGHIAGGFSFSHLNAVVGTLIILPLSLAAGLVAKQIKPVNLLFFGGK